LGHTGSLSLGDLPLCFSLWLSHGLSLPQSTSLSLGSLGLRREERRTEEKEKKEEKINKESDLSLSFTRTQPKINREEKERTNRKERKASVNWDMRVSDEEGSSDL